MAKLNFFTLLQKLEPDEVGRFYKYLKQVQGKNSISVQVFEYYRKFYPDFDDEKKMDPGYARRKIFPEPTSKKDDSRPNLPNTFSDLFLLLKNFLILENIRREERTTELLWLGILYKRGFHSFFSAQADNVYQKMQAEPAIEGEQYWENLGTISSLQFQNLALNKKSPNIGAMQQCLNTFRNYQGTALMKMACQLANAQKLRPIAPLENEPVETPAKPEETILLDIYRRIYRMIHQEDPVLFNGIENLLREHFQQIDTEELQGILGHLRNFLAGRIRKDRTGLWIEKLHQLNLLRLQNDPSVRKGFLSGIEFTNIVSVATSVKELDWVESFIREYGPQLPESERPATLKLSNATVLFARKKFEAAMEEASGDFNDFLEIMRARTLILRCYFELKKDPDTIFGYCHNFEAILLRNRKPKKDAVEAALEFVRICKSIVSMNVDRQILIKRIHEKPSLVLGDWLAEQAQKYRL
jgi:hypothetical protein